MTTNSSDYTPTEATPSKRGVMRSLSFAVMWHSDVKGNREKNGWHPQTEETNAGLVIGRLSFWFGWEAVRS